jgi:DNA-binding FadR family transcriptional regulator
VTIDTVTVADAVRSCLERSLLAGDYPAGEEVRDTHVAQQLGVARPTSRAAVQALIAEGFLVRENGRSARVRRFSREDVTDIFRVRRLIEFEADSPRLSSLFQTISTEIRLLMALLRAHYPRISTLRDEHLEDAETFLGQRIGGDARTI